VATLDDMAGGRGGRRTVLVLVAAWILVAATTSCRSNNPGAFVDGCGNDLSDLHSLVISIDAATGQVQWSTEVPRTEPYLWSEPDGTLRVPTRSASQDPILDLATGEVVDEREHVRRVVTIDASGELLPPGAIDVGGELRMPAVRTGGLEITTVGNSAESGLHLRAREIDAVDEVWLTELAEAGTWYAAIRPLVVGDAVLLSVATDQASYCP
jgi:hypothetical protein